MVVTDACATQPKDLLWSLADPLAAAAWLQALRLWQGTLPSAHRLESGDLVPGHLACCYASANLDFQLPAVSAPPAVRCFQCQHRTGCPAPAACLPPPPPPQTTLLDVLAGRKTQGKIEGEIRYAGHKPTQAFLRRWAGYVEQQGEWLQHRMRTGCFACYGAEVGSAASGTGALHEPWRLSYH